MKEVYPVQALVRDVRRHGDYLQEAEVATVLRVSNLRFDGIVPVVTCKDPNGFKEESGFDHTPETFIRSYMMLWNGLNYETEEVQWSQGNEIYQRALVENEEAGDFNFSFAYDDTLNSMFEKSTTHHYEFDIPNEMLLVVPVDMSQSYFVCLDGDTYDEVINHLAWRQMSTLIPVTNIREVPNE